MTHDTSPPAAAPVPLWKRLIRTALVLAFFAIVFTWLLRFSNDSLERHDRPAGFPMGVLHGICLPAAMPYLLLGTDVPIYAANNTGRTYKLGLTVGINSAGLVFFGSFYRRFSRMKKTLSTRGTNNDSKEQRP